MAKLSSNPKERTEVPAQTTPLWGIALQLEDASASLAYHTMPHPVSVTTKTKKNLIAFILLILTEHWLLLQGLY